tara:strand:+ start:195 stop:407 length:213 start_codon:yes stop_codon:yes gene_type:complete
MKIKLISKDKPITSNWCFKNEGFCSTLLEEINSGKQIEVDRVPKLAWEYVEEVKTIKKKQTKGSNPKGEK